MQKITKQAKGWSDKALLPAGPAGTRAARSGLCPEHSPGFTLQLAESASHPERKFPREELVPRKVKCKNSLSFQGTGLKALLLNYGEKGNISRMGWGEGSHALANHKNTRLGHSGCEM